MREEAIVLKFGSSVLRSPADLPVAVDEIYRHVREGRKVVAVVSAFAGVTDRLIERAHAVGGCADPHAYAALVGSGELESAAMLALSLAQHGVPSRLLPPEQLGLRAHGDPADAEPHDVDLGLLRATLAEAQAVVVPGFLAHDEANRTVLLGRGGSDYTALFLARRLGIDCILLKDVDGLYERDPAASGPTPRRFTQVTWDEALRVAGRLVQPKTIRFAQLHRQSFRVTRPGAARLTLVGPGPSALEHATRPPPIRVVLLGLGTVGRGVYDRLSALPAQFEIARVVVRDVGKHAAAGIPREVLSSNPWDAVNVAADVVVEALGGEMPAAEVLLAALLAGRQVVTANKAALASHWDTFARFAGPSSRALRFSAAAGGAVPVLERLRALAAGATPVAVRGVLNGTCNYLLDRLAQGAGWREAHAEAQALGFTEPDSSADVSGLDAEFKLRLCAGVLFGRMPDAIVRSGIGHLAQERPRSEDIGLLRLVASLTRDGDRLLAQVCTESLEPSDFLAGARGEDNRVEIKLADGGILRLGGKGAGRWPTTAALLGDLWEVARELERADASPRPVPLAASG
jgi:homoserine dehydrogenase